MRVFLGIGAGHAPPLRTRAAHGMGAGHAPPVRSGIFMEKMVYVIDIVEGVVFEEVQFRNDT